jgi:diguanylate cyclase (GGDEF)-like protein/PAS domain S-box-containing protein
VHIRTLEPRADLPSALSHCIVRCINPQADNGSTMTPARAKTTQLLARVTLPVVQRLANLSVGKKLLLIYLLDLSTVIFISSILIHEKYIAIDFSRKELAGTAYIEALRPTLIALGRTAHTLQIDAATTDSLAHAEAGHGEAMASRELNQRLIAALQALPPEFATPSDVAQRRHAALETGRELVTRIGNQSNLILDPDLDSYYTMSLILLRYPTLLDVVSQITPRLHDVVDGVAIDPSERTRLFVLEGELRSAGSAIQSDYSEAIAASKPLLADGLSPAQAQLAGAIDRFRAVVRQAADGTPIERAQVDAAERVLIDSLDSAWSRGNSELTRLIELRVHDFFVRMWTHLGTAMLLLFVILVAVYYVAKRISRPLRGLSEVVDTVRRTGDHTLRSHWNSGDEIGRLVFGFNEMLAQLDHHRQAEQELAASARAAEAQQRLLELMPVPLMVTSIPDHRVLHANPQARAWLGDTVCDPWASGITRELRRRFFQQLADRGVVHEFEVHWQQKDAPAAWAVLSARRLDYQGQDAVVTTFTSINGLKALEQRLELWAKVFEASSEGIVLLDTAGRVLSANRAICKAGAFDPGELLHEELGFVQLGEQPISRARDAWATAENRGWWRGEVAVHRPDGSSFPAYAVLTAVRDATGEVAHYIFSCVDITERKASEEQVRYLAHHDVLTGLPNRSVAERKLREAMQQSRRSGQPVAVLFIDLDRFKTINDSLGHQTGDALLKLVAERLRTPIREVDAVSRFGGDEFVVLLNGVADSAEALQIAQRLRASLRAPYLVDKLELNVSCSIGIAMFPEDAADMDELMRHADTAMYQAKASGRDKVYFFTQELNQRAQQKLQVELLLCTAVARGELRLVYQPQVNTADGGLAAVEALLRWRTPDLGDVAPGVFIPLAEESRQIVPIGEWVIDEACRQLADWRSRDVDVGVMSVNLSAVQLLDPGLVQALRTSLARHRVPAALIELELTESTLMEATDERLRQLHALKEIGVQLSIDDFGTGYSSLSYLSRLPVNKLKIDRSLIRDMLIEPKDRAITEAIIALAHRLNMTVVAEGVESAAVHAALVEARCNTVQGYHTGRTMPADALERWIGSATAGQLLSR